MSVIKTTDVIDNSIYLKADLAPNMVGENYYIENLQDKRDAEWEYRYNRVYIEEELNKQTTYSTEEPTYTPIDVVITNVKNEKGEPLGTDWASLSFRDLKHYNWIGSRYRFALDFPDMTQMTEEEKKYKTSVWLAVNKAPIHAGNSCTIRRCNTTLTLLGYENRDRRKTSTREIHYEPVVLESDEMKYMQIYYNQTVPVPQAEWYAIVQLNYYTNCIKINDRFIFGTLDTEVRDNNSVYKVKAVMKSSTTETFAVSDGNEIASTPLLILALDKDAVAPQDNFTTRIANSAPVYLIPSSSTKTTKSKTKTVEPTIVEPEEDITEEVITETAEASEQQAMVETTDVYTFEDKYSVPLEIALGDSRTYELNLLCNNVIVDNPQVEYKIKLSRKKEADWNKYFRITYLQDKIGFTITNLKTCTSKLEITVVCNIPNAAQGQIDKTYLITLADSY